MHPLAERLAHSLEGQEHWRSLMVDGRLRLRGAKGIFALGDTATIEQARDAPAALATLPAHSCMWDAALILQFPPFSACAHGKASASAACPACLRAAARCTFWAPLALPSGKVLEGFPQGDLPRGCA
jgi:hypothetical protein